MKPLLLLLAALPLAGVAAAEPIYLDCQIPEKVIPGAAGSGREPLTMPAVTLSVTLNEAQGKASQVFKSVDDNFSFTSDAQFTPTEILYESKRVKGFVRTDRFAIDRTTLAVKFVVQYASYAALQPREGVCQVVTRPQTKI